MSLFLQQELIEEGYITEVVDEKILLVKDFITQEELNSILEIINNAKQEDWEIEYKQSLSQFCMEKFGRDDVDNLVAEGKYEITSNWFDKNLNIHSTQVSHDMRIKFGSIVSKNSKDLVLSGFATIQRMQPGVELKSHSDQKTDPSIQYAAILYLNDEYNDGELFFPNKGIELKPSPRSLLIFPGTEEYEHGVRHVGEGPIRYVLVGFIKIKDFYKENKY